MDELLKEESKGEPSFDFLKDILSPEMIQINYQSLENEYQGKVDQKELDERYFI